MKKRAVRLDRSEDIMVYADGDVDPAVLKRLLDDAHDRDLDRNSRVIVSRVKVISYGDNPEWTPAERTYTMRTLERWYKEIHGVKYVHRTTEERFNVNT